MKAPNSPKHQRMFRLLVVVDQQSGGEWIAIKKQLLELHKRYSVVIDFITWKQNVSETDKSFFKSTTLLAKPNSKPPFSFLKNLFHKRRLLQQALNDHINSHSIPDVILTTDYFATVVLKKEARKNSIPLLFSFHGIKSRLRLTLFTINYREIITKILERLALLAATIIIVPAKNGYITIKQQLEFLLTDEKIQIIPNAIDSQFQKTVMQNEIDQFRQKHYLSPQSQIILYCGRLVCYKGIETLLTAFSKIAPSHKKSVLVLAFPSDSVEPALKMLLSNEKQKAQRNGYGNRIVHLTDLSVFELNILYCISWTTVLASESEISPLVMYESLACGTPVIGTRVGDMPDVLGLIDKRLLISPGSLEQLSKAMSWILSLNHSEYKKLRQTCVHLRMNSPQSSVEKLWSILQYVTQKRTRYHVPLLKS